MKGFISAPTYNGLLSLKERLVVGCAESSIWPITADGQPKEKELRTSGSLGNGLQEAEEKNLRADPARVKLPRK